MDLFIGPKCPWGPIYGSWCQWVSTRGFADITDVTLADEDSNTIATDDVNGQSQVMWQCKWHHLVAKIETNASRQTRKKCQLLAKFTTYASSAIWLQVALPGGQDWNKCKWRHPSSQEEAERVWAHSYVHFAAQEMKLPLKNGFSFTVGLD